jgi:hypothetical protein
MWFNIGGVIQIVNRLVERIYCRLLGSFNALARARERAYVYQRRNLSFIFIPVDAGTQASLEQCRQIWGVVTLQCAQPA